MQRRSPRANIGFNKLAASIAPSALPAPTRLCNSSMKRMIPPSDALISLRTAFSRSSNSPLYFAPATNAPMSSSISFFSFKPKGTSPFMMRHANPSTMAVFPTPGSPIKTGLFFVLRDKIWMTLRISSSRPMIGSIFPPLTSSTKSFPYLLNASNWFSDPGLSILCPALREACAFFSSFLSGLNVSTNPCICDQRLNKSVLKRVEALRYFSPLLSASRCASIRLWFKSDEMTGCPPWEVVAIRFSCASMNWIRLPLSRSTFANNPSTTSSLRISASTWPVLTSG